MRYLRNLFFSVLSALLLAVSAMIPGTQAAAETQTYSIGILPQFEARKLKAIWEPIITAVEKESGVSLVVRGAPTLQAFFKQYKDGDFDFAYMNPFYFTKARNPQGYVPLVRDTGRMLQGIIVVHKDSPIQGPAELQDKVMAFPAPQSLAATLLPRAELMDKFGVTVKPKFVRNCSSVYYNVAFLQAEAGATMKMALGKQPDEIKSAVRVIHTTGKLPTQPVAAHPRVPAEVTEKIRAAFLALGKTEEGKKLLKPIPMKKIGATSQADYDRLEALKLDRFLEKK